MDRIFSWGILAPGNIAGKFAAELKSLTNVRILAVGSRDLTRSADFASMHGIERFYGSYAELASDPDLDVIYIASPNTFHAPHAGLCLEKGKAVLCEKPFAMNLSEVTGMISTAKRHGTFLMEALMTPHQPSYLEAKRLIDSGVLGKIRHINGWFGFNRSPYNPEGRLFNPALGGSTLLDIGIYPVFDVLWFMGEPAELQASADLTEQHVDRTVSVSMLFADGSSASVFASFVGASGVGTDIHCEWGMIRLRRSSALHQTLELILPGQEPQLQTWGSDSCGLKLEAVDLMKCLREGKPESDVMSHQHSIRLITLLDAIRGQAGIL